MSTFYLIRHAERSGDPQMLAGRLEGYPLTAVGRMQADRLAQHLGREPIAHVFTSPVQRARETAEALARRFGLEANVSIAFGEIDAGAWTGSRFPQLDADDEQWRRFNCFRSGTPIPGGETMVGVQSRFVGEMLRLREAFPDDGIALVSHADPIKIALACFLGASLDFYDRLEIGLGSVSVVALEAWGAKILRLNDTAREGPA